MQNTIILPGDANAGTLQVRFWAWIVKFNMGAKNARVSCMICILPKKHYSITIVQNHKHTSPWNIQAFLRVIPQET